MPAAVGALHPVSPELVLVDPELARTARALLPEPVPQAAAPVRPAPIQAIPRGRRRERRPALVGLFAIAALLSLLARGEPRPAAVAGIARVAADPDAQARTSQVAASAVTAAAASSGQTFVWVAQPDTSAYEFQLFRGAERIYRARVTAPRLALPGRWRHAGRAYALDPARYRWYVWPISARTGRQPAAATVQAQFVVARPAG